MYRLCLLVLLGVWHASAQLMQLTTPAFGSAVDCNVVGIQNCGKCSLPGMTCAFCADNFVLAADYKSCIACDINCLDCVLDSTGKIGMCQLCAPGYEVKSDGTCGQCGSYCATCTFTDAAETLTDCLACFPTSVDVLYPYLLGSYSKQCQDCAQVTPGCSSCSEAADKTLSCTGCQPGYVGVTNGGTKTCTACPSHCLSCSLAKGATTPTTCATCQTNYVASTATQTSTSFACLYCDPSRCSKCASTPVSTNSIFAKCLTCLKGYYLDNSEVCQPCPEGCATCTSSTACQSCITSGFWLDSANSKCTPCSYGCNTCTFSASKETCTACMAGFGLQSSGVSCQACPEFCDACSDPATCTSCVVSDLYYYTLVADVDGTFCWPCPENCDTCVDDGNGYTSCSLCDSGYVAGTDLNGNSFCFPCPSRCSDCTLDVNTLQTTCTTCEADSNGNDYYLNANNNCVSCGSQCTNCAGGVCGACQPGYFLDSSGAIAKCVKCTLANCMICTPDAATCTDCFPGWYYDGTASPPVCTACAAGCTCTTTHTDCDACKATPPATGPFTNVDAAFSKCLTCDAKCLSAADCDVDALCANCVAGYFPSAAPNAGKTCVKCDPNCATGQCSTGGATGTTAICGGCVPGYYVNAQDGCTKCSTTGCSTCPLNVCSACLDAYTDKGVTPTVCLVNDIHCLVGSSSYDTTVNKVICSSCDTGYTAGTPGACLPNPTGCDVGFLDPTDTTGTTVLCSICSESYGLNSKQLCDPCPANCIACTANALDIQVCDICYDGYAENSFACSECPVGCTACKNVNGEMFCTQCTPQEYYLDSKNGVCVACILCTSCSANGCNAGTCVDGYGLASDLSCTDCATLTTVSGCSNCTDADATGMAMCLDCDNGQVLDGWSANCVDASPLTDCVMPEFRPYECTFGSCNSPFEWVTDGPGRGQCGLHCAVCGDISRGLFLAECQNANNNYTQELVVGACWVGRTVDSAGNVLYARGGFDKFNCTSDNQWEFVDPANSATTYKCCQSGDGCSDEIVLDGVAGASAISFSLALLFASILAALRLF